MLAKTEPRTSSGHEDLVNANMSCARKVRQQVIEGGEALNATVESKKRNDGGTASSPQLWWPGIGHSTNDPLPGWDQLYPISLPIFPAVLPKCTTLCINKLG
jgi:hypothetical protein